MKSIAAMICRIAKCLPIAEKIVFEPELGLLCTEGKKRLRKEIILDVHKISRRVLTVLIGHLCTFSAKVEGADRSSFRIMKRWRDARLLRVKEERNEIQER